ncbi:biotin--[acetyl-CoA-carboxylase] ligase [Chryseobacterium sp. SNU WT5]|uniref:biotin--[acetyl-CoA-carboxylase] ligase n=1 Tax=Chryseobacterium sp. SNU WT5 TaxID=2594269 RepID=UPI00117C492A|nr:biotin--[acetyl-CoA-carboxylase] ligase [Chryseobacterium sp. SNU WT5]QDP85441.1 biotin--[acetyl-CoA-carboxylase] ligase [Chryseobacterium sp. SNU WT5]
MTNLFYVSECSSTQDEIEKHISKAVNSFVATYTFNQTGGKGQYGNHWELQKDLNLAYSIAICTDQIKLPNHLFNFHTAEVLADFVATLTKEVVQIKWPNDLILKNKKIAGILIEKKVIQDCPYFIVGIGLNVLQNDFGDLRQAGSLLTQLGNRFDLHGIAETLHLYLQSHLLHSVTEKEVIEKINSYLFRKDLVSVFEIHQVRQNGIIKEVDAEGFIWIELENKGLKKFFHKEITLLY